MGNPKRYHVCVVRNCRLTLSSRKGLRRHYICVHQMCLPDKSNIPYIMSTEEYKEKLEYVRKGQKHVYVNVREKRRRELERAYEQSTEEEGDVEPAVEPTEPRRRLGVHCVPMWERLPALWDKVLFAPKVNLSGCRVNPSATPEPPTSRASSSCSLIMDLPDDFGLSDNELPTLDYDGNLPGASDLRAELTIRSPQTSDRRTVHVKDVMLASHTPSPSHQSKTGRYVIDDVPGDVTPTIMSEMEVGERGSSPSTPNSWGGSGLDQPLFSKYLSSQPRPPRRSFQDVWAVDQSSVNEIMELELTQFEEESLTIVESDDDRQQAKDRLLARHSAYRASLSEPIHDPHFVSHSSVSTGTDGLHSTSDVGTETDIVITREIDCQTEEYVPNLTSFSIQDGLVNTNYPCGIDPSYIIEVIRRNPSASAHDVVALAQQLKQPKAQDLRDVYLLADGAIRMARRLASEILTFEKNKSTASPESFTINDQALKKLLNDESGRPLVPQGLGAFGILPAVRSPYSGGYPFSGPGTFTFQPPASGPPPFPNSTPRVPRPSSSHCPPGFEGQGRRYRCYRPSASASRPQSQDLFNSSGAETPSHSSHSRRSRRTVVPETPDSPVIIPDDDDDDIIPGAQQPVYEDISSD